MDQEYENGISDIEGIGISDEKEIGEEAWNGRKFERSNRKKTLYTKKGRIRKNYR